MKSEMKTRFYIVIIILIPILFFIIRDFYIKKETMNKGKDIIVKFDSIQKLPKRSYYYFSYFLKGNKISTCDSGLKELFKFNKIEIMPNNFYKAKRNINDPKVIIVNPKEQITDTVAILEAGFSIEDIE